MEHVTVFFNPETVCYNLLHPAGKALTSDWFINSFKSLSMRNIFKIQLEFFDKNKTKDFFT